MTYRVALIGCGRVAQHYVKILTQVDPVADFQVVACCDLVPEKVQHIASAFGAEAFGDAKTMLDTIKPDIVVVLSFSGLHHEHAKMALEAGCHVLVEKPISLVPEHAYELKAIAERKGLLCGVAFQNRFNPAIRKTKETVLSGRLGQITSATIRLRWCREQAYYEDGWHGSWAQDGGVINQQAIHHVDALNWICGPVARVSAASANRLNKLEAEDTMVAALQFDNGALGTIEATTAARPEDYEASLSIVGEGGMIQVGGIALNRIDVWRFVEPRPGDEDAPQRFSQDVPTGYGLSHGPLLKAWVSALDARSNIPSSASPVPVGEAVQAVELVHALYASIESNGWVNLADKPRSRRLGIG